MKCFYHTELEAVATCQRCGKGLCKQCAAKYTPCLCEECARALRAEQAQAEQSAEEQRRQRYRDSLIDTRSEFLKAIAIGAVLVVGFIWLGQFGSSPNPYLPLHCFWLFFAPFGWKLLTHLQARFPVTIFATAAVWLAWGVFKLVICFFIGFPAFIYQLVKTISAQKKIKEFDKK